MSDADDKPTSKRSWFRFSLLTLLMLITTGAVLVEKPVRKIHGKRKIAAAGIKNLSPAQLEWSDDLKPWFFEWLPASWFQGKDRKGIEVVRLTHNYAIPEGDVPKRLTRAQKWAKNDRNMIKLLVKYPEATEDVWAIELSFPLTEDLEAWIDSRSKLRVLEVRSSEPYRDEFIRGISNLKSLEVLTLTSVTPEQVEILKTMKALKWLQVLADDTETIAALRDALPNTYVN